MSKISVLAVGGTISSARTEAGFVPGLGIDSILEGTWEGLAVEITGRDVLRLSSREVSPDHIWGSGE